MQRRYTLALATVVLLVLTVLMVGVDAEAQIAFVSEKDDIPDIYVMNADGQNPQQLTKNRRASTPSWSPDGERIAFASDRGDFEIYVMNANGGNPRKITINRNNDWAPSWSPDSKHIAFASDRDGNDEIYVMDADGGNPRNLTKDRHDDRVPSWSPDGKHIVFSSFRDGAWADIYVININSANLQNLTNSLHRGEWAPSCSPNGKHIAFVSAFAGDEPEIYVMDMDGNNPRQLTDNHWLDNSPSWSLDGKHIVFASKRGSDWNERNGDWDIYVMDTDGGNIQNLTNNPLAHDRQPMWYRPPFAVAPTGKQPMMWGWLKQVVQ